MVDMPARVSSRRFTEDLFDRHQRMTETVAAARDLVLPALDFVSQMFTYVFNMCLTPAAALA